MSLFLLGPQVNIFHDPPTTNVARNSRDCLASKRTSHHAEWAEKLFLALAIAPLLTRGNSRSVPSVATLPLGRQRIARSTIHARLDSPCGRSASTVVLFPAA